MELQLGLLNGYDFILSSLLIQTSLKIKKVLEH